MNISGGSRVWHPHPVWL